MPSDRAAAKALLDIRDYIVNATEFRADKLRYHATTRMLEIISEASKHLTPEIKDRHPAIPWRHIRDSRNFYRHEYDNVAERSIWDTLKQDLPQLARAIEAEIMRLEAKP